MDPIEAFSIEAWFVGAFGFALALMAGIQFLCARFPALEVFNSRFEKFVDWSHSYCEIFPYLFAALLIAVAAPVYDVLLDSAWLMGRGESARELDDLAGAWRYLLTEGSDINSERDLTHALQWMIALGMFWLYSIIWSIFAERLHHDHDDPTIKYKRAALFAGFGAIMAFISWLLNFIGQNSEGIFLLG